MAVPEAFSPNNGAARGGAGRRMRSSARLRSRAVRPLLASVLACAVLVAGVAPGVSAKEPLVLTLTTLRDTAVEGTLSSTTPARIRLTLNRKLTRDEQVQIPLSFAAPDTSYLHVTLHGTPRGVTLSGNRLTFDKGARRAVVHVDVINDVDFDSFTVSVPQQTSSLAQSSQSSIGLSDKVASNGGLTVESPSQTLQVKHLPTASIAVPPGGSVVDEGDKAGFVISLDGTWIGPGNRPFLAVDIKGGRADGRRYVGIARGDNSKNFTTPTRNDRTDSGDTQLSATLIRALGYWVDPAGTTATVTVREDDTQDTQDTQGTQDSNTQDTQGNQDSNTQSTQDNQDSNTQSTQDNQDTQISTPDPQPLTTPEPAQEPEPQPAQEPEPQPAQEPEPDPTPVPGNVLLSHPVGGGEEWLFPWEGSTSGTPFNYCAELDSAPSATVTLSAGASPDLAVTQPLKFGPNSWGRKCFEVYAKAGVDNSTDELPRKVTLSHVVSSADTRYDGIDVADYTLYIGDNDPTKVALGASDTTASEGNAADSAALIVTIGRALQKSVPVPTGLNGRTLFYDEHIDVPLTFSGGKLGEDFRIELSGTPAGITLNGNRVRFAGTESGSATVATIKLVALDDADGIGESIGVSIPTYAFNRDSVKNNDRFAHISDSVANNGGVVLTGTATVTIKDDEPPQAPPPPPPEAQFTTSIWGGFLPEDTGTHTVVMELSKAQASDVTVNYRLTRTATVGEDYTIDGVTSADATVTVPAGQTSVSIEVNIVDDTIAERNEHVRMQIVDGDGYTVGYEKAHTFAITDNDEVTSTTVSVHTFLVYAREGDTVDVVVWLGLPLPESVTIPLVVTSLTAEAGDHGTLSSITIPAGQTAATGAIYTVIDADSDDETFKISLGSPLPSWVTPGADSSTTVLIRDRG